jgi:endonuclease YncB( thermonuclease family)
MGLLVCKNESNALPFSLKSSKLHRCKVETVIDGDTIKCIFKPWFFGIYYLFNIRLLDFDTPELRTKDLVEKEKGIKARDYLFDILLKNPTVYLECGDFDSFGRILGYVYLDNRRKVCVNNLMIEYLEKEKVLENSRNVLDETLI